MSGEKQFASGFHTTAHDFGSLNNSPQNLKILLFSNDRDVIQTEPSQASVRARWRTKLIAALNLQGYWEGRIRRMIVRNTQSHVFNLEIVERGGSNKVVKNVALPRRVYENALDVMEEIVTIARGEFDNTQGSIQSCRS